MATMASQHLVFLVESVCVQVDQVVINLRTLATWTKDTIRLSASATKDTTVLSVTSALRISMAIHSRKVALVQNASATAMSI